MAVSRMTSYKNCSENKILHALDAHMDTNTHGLDSGIWRMPLQMIPLTNQNFIATF